MAESTGISWADATFNPWVGCEKVSPGCLCAHCYAEVLVTGSGPRQLNRPGTWGPEGTRSRTAASTWRNPVKWERLALEGRLPNGGPNPDGHRPRVFCASLADVFEPRPELEPWRAELFNLIAATPHLDWLLLTKRPEEARDWMRDWYWQGKSLNDWFQEGSLFGTGEWNERDDLGWGVLPNIWIGASVENARYTWRADVLREIPAAVRFLSCEPLVGSLFKFGAGQQPRPGAVVEPGPGGSLRNDRVLPGTPGGVTVQPDAQGGAEGTSSAAQGPRSPVPLDLDPGRRIPTAGARANVAPDATRSAVGIDVPARGEPGPRSRAQLDLSGIDWVILGGESGGRTARPMHPGWAREIRDAVLEVSIEGDPPDASRLRPALFFKQWGSWAPDDFGRDPHGVWVSPDGRARSSFAADAYDDLPDGAMRMRYIGVSPKAGGKVLDGVTWCEFPDAVSVPA